MNRLLGSMLLTASLCTPAAAASPPARLRATVEDLGIPRTEREVQARAVLGHLLLAALFETKGAAHLAIVDLKTGAQEEVALPGSTGADALVADEERRIAWIGTSRGAAVWRFDAAT